MSLTEDTKRGVATGCVDKHHSHTTVGGVAIALLRFVLYCGWFMCPPGAAWPFCALSRLPSVRNEGVVNGKIDTTRLLPENNACFVALNSSLELTVRSNLSLSFNTQPALINGECFVIAPPHHRTETPSASKSK